MFDGSQIKRRFTFFLMAYELEDPLAALMISSAKHLKNNEERRDADESMLLLEV